jgi:hypothetical protein
MFVIVKLPVFYALKGLYNSSASWRKRPGNMKRKFHAPRHWIIPSIIYIWREKNITTIEHPKLRAE